MRQLLDLRNDSAPLLVHADPTELLEAELEYKTVYALSRFYPGFRCIVFNGSFLHEGEIFRPDLALFSPGLTYWYVIEVELVSHSLYGHVLPQIRAFRFGEPQSDCAQIIARELGLDLGRAQTLVQWVPRGVAVIANAHDPTWQPHLRALEVSLLTLSIFRTADGAEGFYELDGDFDVTSEHVGFGLCLRTDRSLRLPSSVDLPDGEIHVRDLSGSLGAWIVKREGAHAWMQKRLGEPNAADGAFVQVVRTFDGIIRLRSS